MESKKQEMLSVIKIPKDAISQIEKHGERAYPEECCGIMLGRSDGNNQMVEEVVELDNEQGENRGRRFFVTPKQYLQMERIAVERKLDLLGFYHSHPDHPAVPSEFDRDHALPWFTYIVVSVSQGKARDISAWLLSDTRDRFDRKEFLVEEEVNSRQ
ncbi:MAG TPA: M67 family metallopeptidase [Candidatus Acidoferrales bacterium]|nr:M67 family metallopeptidase [Candidatus Acidoferrales bacterium]